MPFFRKTMVYGRLLQTSGQYVRLNKRKALAEYFGEKAHQKGRDDDALPNAIEPAEKEQRQHGDELHGIALRLHPEQQVHGEVDEVPEHNGNGDLQDVNSELQRQGFCVFFC